MESINIQNEVSSILKLVQDLEGKFSKNYLVRILRGNPEFTKPEHKQLPQFGEIAHWSENKIGLLIEFLYQKEYLVLKNQQKGSYELSRRGQKYLNKSSEFWVKEYELKPIKRYYYLAMKALKEERKSQAKEKNCSTFELCSNFQLEQMIIQDFETVEQLNQHSIFKDWEGKVDWNKMLLILRNCKKEYYSPQNLSRYSNYTKIETLILQGKTIAEILNILNIKFSTLTKYVESLYENGNHSIKEWIYKNVSKKNLVKCIEYFTKTQNYQLKDAKAQLELDYETIRLGRIYYRIQQITVAA